MDRFWAWLRIGCFGVFAILALGFVGCTAVNLYRAHRDGAASGALWARAAALLNQHKSHVARVSVRDLFGADADGVCLVWNGAADEGLMRKASPPRFREAVAPVVRAARARQPDGMDSDTQIWLIFPTRDGRVLRQYQLTFKSALDLDRGDDPDRCYDAGAPLELRYWPASRQDEQAMMLLFHPGGRRGD